MSLTLSDICEYRTETTTLSDIDSYLSTESMLPNKQGITRSSALPDQNKFRIYRCGDTLVSNIRPYFKKIWQADHDGTCSADVLVFKPLHCDPSYLYWVLSDDDFFDYMTATSRGTKMPRGDKDAIMRYRIDPCSFQVQKQIAAVLNPIRSKILINARINDHLAEMAMMLFDSECPQTNEPNAVLSDVAEITMGQSPSGSSYNENGHGEVFYQGRGEFGSFFPRRHLFTTEPKRMAREGDILVSVRAPVGDLNIAAEDCCIGRGLAAIHSGSNQSFVHYLMRAQKRQLDTFNGDGTVFGSINGKALKELSVYLPSNDGIAHLQSLLEPIDAMIRRNDDEMQALEQLRDALLPRLMSGEIDISQIGLRQLNGHLGAPTSLLAYSVALILYR